MGKMQQAVDSYFRKPELLPAQLPTIDEIRSATNVIKGSEPWASEKIVTIGTYYLVKYGTTVELLEGRNLLFLEENLARIVVPRLYAMWVEAATNESVLIMERLDGESLATLWPDLADSDKTFVLRRVKELLEAIRALPSPGYFGNVSKGPLPHPLFWSSHDNMMKSFDTATEMVMFLAQKSKMNHENMQKHSFLADFYERHFTKSLGHTKPVFTHSDVQRKNIIVKTNKNFEGYRDCQVTLVDWECAGWYPAYWEYVSAFFAFQWDDDWTTRVEECIDAWPAEATMMSLIHRDLWL